MRLSWQLAALGVVYILYVWMFVASEGVVLLAKQGACTGPDVVVAKQFAGDWRHGLTGHSPLYMPGFFLLAATTWLWANDQRARQLLREALPLLGLALIVGIAFAPIGTEYLVHELEARQAVTCTKATTTDVSLWRLFLCLFTMTSLSIVSAGVNRAVTRGWRVLRIPAVFAVAATALRPPTRWPVFWARAIAAGDIVAVGSVIFIVTVIGMLWRWRILHARVPWPPPL
jgi:hypothetical protein